VNLTVPRQPVDRDVSFSIRIRSSNGPDLWFNGSIHIALPNLLAALSGNFTGVAGRGLMLTASISVHNDGDGGSVPSSVRLLLDGTLVEAKPIDAIPPAGSATMEFTFNASAGNHTLRAVVDPTDIAGGSRLYGTVFESNESDNFASTTFTIAAGGAPADGGQPGPISPTMGTPSLLLAIAGAVTVAGLAMVLWVRKRGRQKDA
jgi:hypothetical protein